MKRNILVIVKDEMLVKGVVFYLDSDLPLEARSLLEDFRLAVNCSIRAGLQARVTSRNALCKIAYKDFREQHPRMYAQHLVSAFEVACGILKNHRKRVRKDVTCSIPFVKRLMMKAENQAYKLDRRSGVIDLPIRAGCHVELRLIVSQYHRKYLDDTALSLGSLTILPNRVIVTFRKDAPKPYTPDSVISLDTNERSLDGVFVEGDVVKAVKAGFPEVAIIQQRHHDRRRRLQKKKAHDMTYFEKPLQERGNEGAPPSRLQAPPGGELGPEVRGRAEICNRSRGPEMVQIEKEQRTESAPQHLAQKETTPDHRVQGSVERNLGLQSRPEKQQQNVPDMWEDTIFPNGCGVRV